MRPRQWVKNGVIFAALIFDRQLGLNNLGAFFITLAGFIIFCLLSGLVYLINDIADIQADRSHPDKKNRPIASGQLPVRVAAIFAAILVLIIFPISLWLSPAFFLVAVSYFAVNLAYSKWLKHVPIIDVLTISLGFVLRVLAGITLIETSRFSPWLVVVTTLGALLLGFGKRKAELVLLQDGANAHRKVLDGYTLSLVNELITIAASTTIMAYGLYTFSAPNLPANYIMMLTIPFVLYGIFRYLYLLDVEGCGGAPEDVLFSDRPLQITIILWGISILLIFYIY
jgi:4-hydroxybenzoate polyprenyltransferase